MEALKGCGKPDCVSCKPGGLLDQLKDLIGTLADERPEAKHRREELRSQSARVLGVEPKKCTSDYMPDGALMVAERIVKDALDRSFDPTTGFEQIKALDKTALVAARSMAFAVGVASLLRYYCEAEAMSAVIVQLIKQQRQIQIQPDATKPRPGSDKPN